MNPPARTKLLPRHRAGKMDLIGGSGPITQMIGVDGFMEIYKVDMTFRVQAPENIDPAETVDDVPWVATPVSEVGSGNPIVARIFVQGAEALKHANLKRGNPKRILHALHRCKEEVLICEGAYRRLLPEYQRICAAIEAGDVKRTGRNVNAFPHLADLDAQAAAFIASAKRALQRVAEIFNELYGATIKNANFHLAPGVLRAAANPNAPYIQFLEDTQPVVRHLLDLRNFQEHAEDQRQTVIRNFTLTPQGAIKPPTWCVPPAAEVDILADMPALIEFLIEFTELNFLLGLQETIDSEAPYAIYAVEAAELDPACPVKYHFEIDRGKFFARFPRKNPPV